MQENASLQNKTTTVFKLDGLLRFEMPTSLWGIFQEFLHSLEVFPSGKLHSRSFQKVTGAVTTFLWLCRGSTK